MNDIFEICSYLLIIRPLFSLTSIDTLHSPEDSTKISHSKHETCKSTGLPHKIIYVSSTVFCQRTSQVRASQDFCQLFPLSVKGNKKMQLKSMITLEKKNRLRVWMRWQEMIWNLVKSDFISTKHLFIKSHVSLEILLCKNFYKTFARRNFLFFWNLGRKILWSCLTHCLCKPFYYFLLLFSFNTRWLVCVLLNRESQCLIGQWKWRVRLHVGFTQSTHWLTEESVRKRDKTKKEYVRWMKRRHALVSHTHTHIYIT